MALIILTAVLLSNVSGSLAGGFNLAKEYSGPTFFDGFDYYGAYDSSTFGQEIYVNKSDSTGLTFLNSAGNAIIKLDNTSFVPYWQKRNSVRLTTQQWFGVGTLWVIDAIHVPFGCSVWPAIWTSGVDWPNNGEIDIIEGVNQVQFNQMSIHTRQGCTIHPGEKQSGKLTEGDCSQSVGCVVQEATPNSYGQNLANNGGGVWAAQYDVSGIYIWFWPRTRVPDNLKTVTNQLDISSWGTPSAAYAAPSCNVTDFFGGQQLIIDIALCGQGADSPGVYAQTCQDTKTNACYLDNVINNGTSAYANAYFELASIRVFSPQGLQTVFDNSSAAGTASPSGPNPTGQSTPTSGVSPASVSPTTSGALPFLSRNTLALMSCALGIVFVMTH